MAFQPTSGSGSVSGSSASSGFQFFSSPFVDTTYTKVFVGGLAWETQSETMRRYFEQFGEILEAVVISDKNTRKSKGYGFVTFRDPESARRACANPSPVIDGRRANCNLASLGRPRISPAYGSLRPAGAYFEGVQWTQGAFVQSSTHHQPFSYGYQQGYAYPPYGYMTCGPEYQYPQVDGFKISVYSPHMGQQYLQIYGIPGTVNMPIYPFGQFSTQPLPGGHGYTAVQGYGVPSHHVFHFGGPSVNAVTSAPIPTIQAPYSTGVIAPVSAQTQFIVPARPPQFTLGSGSIQLTG